MLDPVEAFKKTTSLLVPTATTTHGFHPSDTAFPTVIPDPAIYEHVTVTGQRTLWVVFVLMLLASAVFAGLSWTVPVSKRLYHSITTLITIIAAISYFAMATGAGVNYKHSKVVDHHKHVPNTHHDLYRQIYWARYVDWALTTPLLLLDLTFLAGLSGAHIVMAIIADVIMVLTGLFAAYGSGHNPQKWGWYTIACIAFVVVIWHLVVNGRAGVKAKGANITKFYAAISLYTIVLWTAYPIIWAIADGVRILSVDQEIIAYAVLDILAKPVFGTWLLLTHTRLAESNIEVGGWWSYGLNSEGRVRLDDEDGA